MINLNINGLHWFDDSPDTGDPACICSHCGQIIADGPPIRLFNSATGQEARLHYHCMIVRTRNAGHIKDEAT